jgi:glycosyltransferase involved in cell wall biosynthesis
VTEPAVSIVLASHERLRHLRTAVDAVRAQTLRDWELIIVDDGSGPEVRAWLRGQRDERVRVLELQRVGYPAAVRNAGIAAARAPYIAFLDSDDVWVSDYLARQLATLRGHPTRRWCYCKTRMIDEHDQLLPEEWFRPWRSFDGAIAAALLRREASVATASVVAERTLIESVGGFDARLRFVEDYELWLKLALRSEVAVTEAPLVHIRTHSENYTRDRIASATAWCAFYRHVEAGLRDPRLRALCREMRGVAALQLARARVARRDWPGGVRSLLASVPFGVMHASWWRALPRFKALAGGRG